jgi:GxxExxY protein
MVPGICSCAKGLVVVELKSVQRVVPVFEAQVLTCLRISGKRAGLLIKFDSRLLTRGMQRSILSRSLP